MTILFKSISDIFSLEDIELKDEPELFELLEILGVDKYWVNGDGIFFNRNYPSEELYKILFYISAVYRFELDQDTSYISYIVSNRLGKYFRSIDFIEDEDRNDNDVLYIERNEYNNLYGEIKGKIFGIDNRKPRCPYCGGEKINKILYTDFYNKNKILQSNSELKCISCNQIFISKK